MKAYDIRKVRKSLGLEWQRQTFDAFMLPMRELNLAEIEQKVYVRKAKESCVRIDWTSYDTVRRSFMGMAEDLLKCHKFSLDEMLAMRRRMYVRFMEGRILAFEFQERLENVQDVSAVPVREQDFHNTEMAAVFAHLPDQPEVLKWLEYLEVSWHYEQLHMVTWFSGQLSLGEGKYSRSRPNHSAGVTYQRLLNPYSLLWIAAALGENPETVRKAAALAKQRGTFKEKCIVIRNLIPFSRIYELALPLAEKEQRNGPVA